jgi:hypothetical protein
MRHVETIPAMGGGLEIKENDGEGDFKHIWYIVITFVNAIMYPQHNNKNIKKKNK